MLSQVVELIENKHNFAITTHVRPDGDGIGSSLGLCWLLRRWEKKRKSLYAMIFRLHIGNFREPKMIKRVSDVNGRYDAVFVIECSDLERPGIGNLENQFNRQY